LKNLEKILVIDCGDGLSAVKFIRFSPVLILPFTQSVSPLAMKLPYSLFARPHSLASCGLLLIASGSYGATYVWEGDTDNNIGNPANWVGNVAPPGGANVVLPVGDIIDLKKIAGPTGQNLVVGSIVVPAGAELRHTGGEWTNIDAPLSIAGTGTDGLGALKAGAAAWTLPQNMTVADNATILIQGNRLRVDGAANQTTLTAGRTLTVNGIGEWNWVNSVVNVSGAGNTSIAFNAPILSIEGNTRIPATVTTTMAPGTLVTSWDGAPTGGESRQVNGNFNLNGAQIEGRHNDQGKIYNGTIGLSAGATGTFNAPKNDNQIDYGNGDPAVGVPGPYRNSINQRIVSTGQITGAGALSKVGAGTLDIHNATNNYTGGTTVSDGILRLTADPVLNDAVNWVNPGNVTLRPSTGGPPTAVHADPCSSSHKVPTR